jgi:dihydroorotase
MNIRICGGRVVDPSQRMDRISDLWIENGKIVRLLEASAASPSKANRKIDAKGKIVSPGFVDLHVHFRDPGQLEKEDLTTGTHAAAAGGFTSVLCMPNTSPVNDSAEVTRYIVQRAAEVGRCRVYPVGAITKGLLGKSLSPMRELKEAGCIAFSDDGRPVNDAALMREALTKSRELGTFLIEHCEELELSKSETVHEGEVARSLGLKGISRSVETVDATRTLTLAAETGARVHLAHLSCAESVSLIEEFKPKLSGLTAEVTPHHLALTVESVREKGTNAKMYPPLREDRDRTALGKALARGTIDVVATDHAPHTAAEKSKTFDKAPNGIIGSESALFILMDLVDNGILTIGDVIRSMSSRPAEIAGLNAGSLRPGSPADVVIFDPDEKRTFTESDIFSKSKNSPFVGTKGKGRVLLTMVAGRETFPGWE